MRTIIKFFLDNSKLTYLLTLFFIIFGINGMKSLLREETPNVNIGQARITTYYPGATAEEVEIEVTKKIEDRIKEVSGIKKVRSVSQTNISIIKAEIDIDNFDQEEVMDDLKDAVERANDLPATASKPDFLEIDTKEFSVIEVAIVGSNENRKRDAYAEFLEDELKDIKGVLKVDKYGYAEREFTIRMDLEKLIEHNVGVDEVVSALQSKNINVPAGNLKSYENQAMIRIDAKSKNKEELENVLVRSNFEDKKIYVKDVAEVVDLMEDQEAYTKINGEDCTILAIKKQASVDTINLSKEVKAKIEEYNNSKGNEFKAVYFVNAATDVENKFNIIVSNVIFGVVSVLVFMLIFLPGKIGIVSSICLPIIVMTTLGLMPALGINIDSISMLAIIIALGMIVDNSVLVSENFSQLIEEGNSINEAALNCAAKFWVPILITTLTTVFAFMPMFLTKGVMGLFISAIPTLVSLTLVISIIECIFFLPTRLRAIGPSIVKAKMKRLQKGNTEGDWFTRITRKFEKLVYIFVKHRYISLCFFAGIIMFSLYMLSINQFILFPPEDVDEYNVKYETNIGDSLEKTSELTTRLTNDIYNAIGKDNIENIVAYIGQSGTGLLEDLQQNHHTAELKIYIYKDKSYILNYKDVLNKLRNMDTSYLTKFEVTEKYAGPDVGKAIEANFRSSDEDKLYEVINHMKTELAKVDGIIDMETNDYKNDDEIFIKLDYEKIARLGFSVSYISNLIKTSISGMEIAKLTLNNREFSMLAKFKDAYKMYDSDLEKIKIRDNNGNLIPLSEIATLERVEGSRMKHRLDFKKNVALRANVNVNKITALEGNAKVAEIFNKIKDQYPEVSLKFGGEQENAEESFGSLIIASQYALILVVACLVFMFNSYFKPLLIMTTVPLGLLGFAVAFYLHQRPISFLAVIGVIGLIGVVVNVGIILISFIEMMKKERKDLTLNEILAKASGARLRAVMASAITTVSGLLPTAYGLGGRDASLIPVTLSMAWGLISSTLLSLIWIPCAYGILEDCSNLIRKAKVAFWKFRRRSN